MSRSQRRMAAFNLRLEIVTLSAGGLRKSEIARRIGVSPQYVGQVMKRVSSSKPPKPNAPHLRSPCNGSA